MKKRVLSLLMMLCVVINLITAIPITANAASIGDYVTVNLYMKKSFSMMWFSCVSVAFNSEKVQVVSYDVYGEEFSQYGGDKPHVCWALTSNDKIFKANETLMTVKFKILSGVPEFYIWSENSLIADFLNNYEIIEGSKLNKYVGIEVVYGDSEFQVDIYRARHLINSDVGKVMENTYINTNTTPCKILYDAGQENGLDDAAAAWTALMDTLNVVDNPSSIVDYVFEEKDIYSAIIMNMFESSVDYKIMGYIDNEITKQSRSLVSIVTSSMKSLYNIDVIDTEAVRNMTDKQKDNFTKELGEAFKEVHGVTNTISNINKMISNGIKYGKDIQKICQTIEVYKNIADLSDSMKFVMRKMYDKCPNSNVALKSALLECIAVMNSGKAAFAAEMTMYTTSVAGKDIAQVGIDKLWGGVKSSFSAAHPAAFAFKLAYESGKYITQVCFNADSIVEKYYNLVAMVNVEQVMSSVYDDLKGGFRFDQTQFNAKLYNSAVDIMFNMKDTDCNYAIKYAEAVEGALASKLAKAFGDNTIDELKQSVESIRNSTSLYHVTVLTDWINQLYEDDIDKYYEYEHLIYKSYQNYNKKYDIDCPADLYIYDMDGNVVGSVEDDVPFCAEDSDITMLVSGDEKTIYMNNDDEYNIVYKGKGNGAMDIIITEYDETKSTARSVCFNNVSLTDGATYTSSENGTTLTENAYVLIDQTEGYIEPDYDSLTATESEIHTAQITRGYFADTMAVSQQLNYGQNVEITAYIPEGYEFVGWSSDSNENIFEDASSITTKIVMPDHDVNITANIIKCPTLCITEITNNKLTFETINCENITEGNLILAVYDDDGALNHVTTKEFAKEGTFNDLILTNGKAKLMLWGKKDILVPLTKPTEKVFCFETVDGK